MARNWPTHQGVLDIGFPPGGLTRDDTPVFRLTLIDATSRVQVCEIEIKAEDLAVGITGRAQRPVVFQFNPNPRLIGATHEHKHEMITVPRKIADIRLAAIEGRREDPAFAPIAKLLKPFEVEGWKADLGDLHNGHRTVSVDHDNNTKIQDVSFHRFVDADGKVIE